MLVMMVPIATILRPLAKIAPWIYRWRVRGRILHRYSQLKRLERRLVNDGSIGGRLTQKADLARIGEAVCVMPVALAYNDELYMLKAAMELVF